MRKSIMITAALIVLSLFVSVGCVSVPRQIENAVYQDENYDIGVHATAVNEAEMRFWSTPPAVFVNDTWFGILEGRDNLIPALDDSWTFLGVVQTVVELHKSPTENFQSNSFPIGARIYHSYEGRIPVTNNIWGEPIDEEAFGNSIILVFDGTRVMLGSEEARDEFVRVMEANGVRKSLNIEGMVYSLMATVGGGFITVEDYIFLGEVMSSSDINEYPIENLQANRSSLIGARVYRLPQGKVNDIVVFHDASLRFYFSFLPFYNTCLAEEPVLEPPQDAVQFEREMLHELIATGEFFTAEEIGEMKAQALSWQERRTGMGSVYHIVVIEPLDSSEQKVFLSLMSDFDEEHRAIFEIYERLRIQTAPDVQVRILNVMNGAGSGEIIIGYEFTTADEQWIEVFDGFPTFEFCEDNIEWQGEWKLENVTKLQWGMVQHFSEMPPEERQLFQFFD